MNYKKLGKILGKIMILEGILMVFPLLVSLIYQEGATNAIAFLVPIAALILLGFLLQIPKPKRNVLYQKEGFALTALVWVVMALFGAIPFVINRDIPNYVDACFEIMSGFTTTGASIVDDVTLLSRSTLFWRSFSHWIGGMGILVFVLIFIPESNDGSSMHLLRAESPGPQVGKIVSKMKATTRILYLIYLGLTVLEVIFLLFDPRPITGYTLKDKFFFSLLTAFGSAGTGGFGFVAGSMELYSPYSQYVIASFLLLFGINFSLYYLILIGKAKEAFRSKELHAYLLIVVGAILLIFTNLVTKMSAVYGTEEAFRHSFFQVAALITTTGYSTTDFNLWPMTAVSVLVVLMFMGGMAGSTAGGMKTSRIMIALKGAYVNVRKLINPRYVPKVKFEGKTLEEKTINDVFAFMTLYLFILIAVTFLLSFDAVNGTVAQITSSTGGTYEQTHGFFTNFSSALSCLSNIGPGFEAVGAYASFSAYNPFSKILLTLTMLIGRLEILPVLLLFSPKTWKKV
jgi:trk system potassium uptake protein TrkH